MKNASHTRTARLSYSIGVVDGLKCSVFESKKREKERREVRFSFILPNSHVVPSD